MGHRLRSTSWVAAMLASASVAIVALTLTTAAGTAQQQNLRLEVAEDGPRFVMDQEQHVDDQGRPMRGNPFVAEGWLYPEGTLTCDGIRCNGVLLDANGVGSPEFPDLVVGRWTCQGMHVQDQPVTTGPIFMTTQLFDLGPTVGADMIVTTGTDIVDLRVVVDRAITGGTGEYAGATGVHHQRYIGLNNLGLVRDGLPLFGGTFAVELDITLAR